MKPPKAPENFETPDLLNFTDVFIYVYKLINNLYGLNEPENTWYVYLKNGLIKKGWCQLSIDECLLTKKKVILVIYVDGAILISPVKKYQ